MNDVLKKLFQVVNFDAETGLPDGLFLNQKSQFGKIL
jgi:hypothetical protein